MNFKKNFLWLFLCGFSVLYGQENSSNTTLYNTIIDLSKGTETWASNMAAVIFDTSVPDDEIGQELYLSSTENTLQVYSELPMNSDKKEGTKNCSTQKKTCRSEKCVTETLIKILGDGDRNVTIKYERKLLSVQIYYTYQDCN